MLASLRQTWRVAPRTRPAVASFSSSSVWSKAARPHAPDLNKELVEIAEDQNRRAPPPEPVKVVCTTFHVYYGNF